MTALARTTQTTRARPATVFALWADINHWADFDDGIEWAKTDEAFRAGSHYVIKPKGGPQVKSTILLVEPPTRFVDVAHLFGAQLKFDHAISEQDGITTVGVVMTISGPLSWFWTKLLGKNQQADLEKATANLLKIAEGQA
jgi:hypothetical protein